MIQIIHNHKTGAVCCFARSAVNLRAAGKEAQHFFHTSCSEMEKRLKTYMS